MIGLSVRQLKLIRRSLRGTREVSLKISGLDQYGKPVEYFDSYRMHWRKWKRHYGRKKVGAL